MNFGRAIWADLVEKRLWPVAALLVLGLIAVPVALPKLSGGAEPAPPLPVAAPVLVAKGPAPVTVVDDLSVREPTGRYDDPFTGGPAPSTSSAPERDPGPAREAGGASSSGSGSTAPSASPPAEGSASKPAAAAPAPSPSPSPSPRREPEGVAAGWRVDAAWGPPEHARRYKDLERLRILRTRSRQLPGVIFLGVSANRRTAYFVPAPGVVSFGDGRCLPSADRCEVIAMRRRAIRIFDIPSDDGMARYQLEVNRIAQRRAADAEAAEDELAAVSESGEDLLDALVESGGEYLSTLAYSVLRGVVRRLSTPRTADESPATAGSSSAEDRVVPAQ